MADYQRLLISEVPVTVVRFTDSTLLDPFGEIREAGEELRRLLDEGRKHLLLNFGSVTLLSTAMLSELITLRDKVIAVNGTLTLTNITPHVYEIFKKTALDRLFKFRNDQADALPSI